MLATAKQSVTTDQHCSIGNVLKQDTEGHTVATYGVLAQRGSTSHLLCCCCSHTTTALLWRGDLHKQIIHLVYQVSSIKVCWRRKEEPQGLNSLNLLLEGWEGPRSPSWGWHFVDTFVVWDTASAHTCSLGCPKDISPKLIWKSQYKPMARCIKPQDNHYAEAHFLLSTAGQLIL